MRYCYFIMAMLLLFHEQFSNKHIGSTNIEYKNICGKYITRPPGTLFYTENIITLNCDSTFTFSRHTCLGIDSSFGKWKFNNEELILLKTNKFNKRYVTQKPFGRIQYLDLSKNVLKVDDDYLILKFSENYIDTLYKQ